MFVEPLPPRSRVLVANLLLGGIKLFFDFFWRFHRRKAGVGEYTGCAKEEREIESAVWIIRKIKGKRNKLIHTKFLYIH